MGASIAQKRPHISISGLRSAWPVAIITAASLARSSTWSGPLQGELTGSQSGHQSLGVLRVIGGGEPAACRGCIFPFGAIDHRLGEAGQQSRPHARCCASHLQRVAAPIEDVAIHGTIAGGL